MGRAIFGYANDYIGSCELVTALREVQTYKFQFVDMWKCQVLCSLETHKNQFGIGTEQLDRYLSSFYAVREGRKFSRRGL
ncbi:MAG: hypothetical protein IKE29_15765, partial [Paenibacillus sp.]|uniref:hypothetical protein n=1 Tax=Paenibacillus sp. TaxID=58172 RepID=UPI0025DA5A19